MSMNDRELRNVGEVLAKATAVYHKAVAENSKCRPDELTSNININDSEYLYKIIIKAEPLNDST